MSLPCFSTPATATTRRWQILRIFLLATLLCGVLAVSPTSAATTFADGDVFVSVGNGQVQWHKASGALVNTLTTNAGGFTTGLAFDTSGNLYVTNFSNNTVSKFDRSGIHIGEFGSGYNSAPESIVFDKDGNAYVGHADGARAIRKYDPSGNFVAAFQAQTDDRGTDWIDLADDQCTMYYTSEGPNVKRYNVCTNTQLANFNVAQLPAEPAYALRILSTGGVMVADTSAIVRLNTDGTLIQTYDAPGHDCWFALNLDPDAKSFWSADYCTSDVYKFDLANGTGTKIFNTGTSSGTVFGLTVKGEITAAQPCALPAFADTTNGNPIRQDTDQLRQVPYGGHEFNIAGRTVFLPFKSGEPDNSIARWGCYLTSGAMVINYFAAQQGKTFRTDPATLNDWMSHNLTNNNSGYASGTPLPSWQNPQYVASAFVDPTAFVQYAAAHDIDMAVASNVFGRNQAHDDLLNQAMCALNPAILAVRNSNHWVAATGKTKAHNTDTWRLHDPLAAVPTNLLDVYGNSYDRQVIFSGDKPRSAILLSLYSPAEVVISDPLGRRTGLDPRSGTSFAEIPSSSYGQEFLGADGEPAQILERKVLYIDAPINGAYTIEVIGTGNGPIGLDVVPIDTSGDGPRITIADTVTAGVVNVYQLTYSATPGQSVQFIRPIAIDIKPGETPNSINLSDTGVTPVAILSAATFDATRVNPASVTLAGASVARKSNGSFMASAQDVNGDGRLDLVVQVKTKALRLSVRDTQATLEGRTVENLAIRGVDTVRIVR